MKYVNTIIYEPWDQKTILNHRANDECELRLTTNTKVFWCRAEDFHKYKPHTSDSILKSIERKVEVFPPRFRSANLYDVSKHIQDYCIQDKFKDKGLFIHGPCGTGKTYALYAMAKTFIANDYKVLVHNCPQLLEEMKAEFDMTSDPYYVPLYKKLTEFEGVLMIDDIGAEKSSDWSIEKIYNIINQRYENMLTTVVTSNFSPKELKGMIGDRIVSRMVEMCFLIKLEGNDKRLDAVQVFKN